MSNNDLRRFSADLDAKGQYESADWVDSVIRHVASHPNSAFTRLAMGYGNANRIGINFYEVLGVPVGTPAAECKLKARTILGYLMSDGAPTTLDEATKLRMQSQVGQAFGFFKNADPGELMLYNQRNALWRTTPQDPSAASYFQSTTGGMWSPGKELTHEPAVAPTGSAVPGAPEVTAPFGAAPGTTAPPFAGAPDSLGFGGTPAASPSGFGTAPPVPGATSTGSPLTPGTAPQPSGGGLSVIPPQPSAGTGSPATGSPASGTSIPSPSNGLGTPAAALTAPEAAAAEEAAAGAARRWYMPQFLQTHGRWAVPALLAAGTGAYLGWQATHPHNNNAQGEAPTLTGGPAASQTPGMAGASAPGGTTPGAGVPGATPSPGATDFGGGLFGSPTPPGTTPAQSTSTTTPGVPPLAGGPASTAPGATTGTVPGVAGTVPGATPGTTTPAGANPTTQHPAAALLRAQGASELAIQYMGYGYSLMSDGHLSFEDASRVLMQHLRASQQTPGFVAQVMKLWYDHYSNQQAVKNEKMP